MLTGTSPPGTQPLGARSAIARICFRLRTTTVGTRSNALREHLSIRLVSAAAGVSGASNDTARIADHAGPGEVLVTQEVVEAAKGTPVTFTEIGPVELKGVSDTIRLYSARRAA